MSRQKFDRGSFVKIKAAAKTDENKRRVKEDTYGSVNSTFEVVYSTPPLEIQGETGPASYWITPIGKMHSTVCMFEHELRAVRRDSKLVKKAEEEPIAVDTSDLDDIEIPDMSGF